MTVREACEIIGIDDNPIACAFVIAAIFRTAIQREPSTFDGECLTVLEACKQHGKMSCPKSVRRWLKALGVAADHDFPNEMILELCEASARDYEDHKREGAGDG